MPGAYTFGGTKHFNGYDRNEIESELSLSAE